MSIISRTNHSVLTLINIDGIDYVKKVSYTREHEFLSKLRHPHIILPISVSSKEIILPLYKRDLFRNSGNIIYDDLLKITRGLLSALQYIHSMGIVHADVKPENILLDDNLNPILIDFTSALYIKDCNEKRPLSTESYIAPEVLLGHTYNEKIDIWGCGVTLLKIIHGMNPFSKKPVSQYEEILTSETIKSTLKNFNRIGSLIEKMLSLHVETRYSASECLVYLM